MKYKETIKNVFIVILGFMILYLVFMIPTKSENIKNKLFNKTIPKCAKNLQDNIEKYLHSEADLHDDLWNCMNENYPSNI